MKAQPRSQNEYRVSSPGPGRDFNVMKVLLSVVLLVEACLGAENCPDAMLYHDLSSRVVLNGSRATADVCVKKCHRVKSIHVDHRLGGFSFKCSATLATNSCEHFVCGDLPLDMRFNLTVTISGSDEYINNTIGHLFTTDVQSVSVEPGTTTASVTCRLAPGNVCQGCHVWWRDANGEGGEAVAYKMSQNSLTANTTISPLIPGHAYFLAVCDVESDESLSVVKVKHLFETKSAESTGNLMLTVAVSVISPVILLCVCVFFCVLLVWCYRLKGQVATDIISKLKPSRRKDRTPEDQGLQDNVVTPPLPPRTTDMFIPATVSSTSTASTESTTADDAIVTDSIFDDGTTGTPTNAHSIMITFTVMISSENVGSAPPIPPRTNEMYLLEHLGSKMGTTCAQAHVSEEGSDTESMLAWNEEAKTEVDRKMEYPDDTISETSWDIGFPPPIPQQTEDMFLAQSFDPSDHTTFQITMTPNTSYTAFETPKSIV